jgi:hypothetical protein
MYRLRKVSKLRCLRRSEDTLPCCGWVLIALLVGGLREYHLSDLSRVGIYDMCGEPVLSDRMVLFGLSRLSVSTNGIIIFNSCSHKSPIRSAASAR